MIAHLKVYKHKGLRGPRFCDASISVEIYKSELGIIKAGLHPLSISEVCAHTYVNKQMYEHVAVNKLHMYLGMYIDKYIHIYIVGFCSKYIYFTIQLAHFS